MTTTHHSPGVHTVIGVDAGSANLREADHTLHRLATALDLPPRTIACTHLVRSGDRPRTVLSIALPDADTAQTVWDRLTPARPDATAPVTAAALGSRRHGPHAAAEGAAVAAAEHALKSGGRAVIYPGVEHLTGTVTVTDLLARSAIDRLVMVGAPSGDGDGPDPAVRVLTHDHVRPEWRDGRLALALAPAPGGSFAPFEVPNPTPCCADHS